MQEETIIIAFVAIIIIVILLAFFFSKKAIVKRKLKNSELKRLSSFRSGEIAKIVGKVKFVDSPLIAPLSGRECSHYHVLIEQERSTGKSSTWDTLVDEERHSKYLIKDGSKYAYINDSLLKSYIVDDAKYKSGFLNDPTENMEYFLNNKGIDTTNFFGFNKTLRCKEGVLEKDEEISVYGHGEWKEAIELGLPEEYGQVLEITSTNEEAIYLSDDPATTEENEVNINSSRKHEVKRSRYRK
ncbi:hypothetical protein [Marinifilum sp. D714]|uniref:hypothetical protein n=1 Tax=Marinifilum sp. D714 TaxID=2937523 RepID=UPI0027CA38DA|nr:hypothetical protein [Marinifilum sp. D714]MDQ2177945.1 hypothetical protein [Marinifilum sp. D714]